MNIFLLYYRLNIYTAFANEQVAVALASPTATSPPTPSNRCLACPMHARCSAGIMHCDVAYVKMWNFGKSKKVGEIQDGEKDVVGWTCEEGQEVKRLTRDMMDETR